MNRRLTLIEIVVVFVFVLIFLPIAIVSIGQGYKLSIGRDLEMISQENTGVMIKRHWRDRNSGECFYTLGEDARGALFPEPCR